MDVNNNYIEVFALDYLKNLKVLNCASNRITELKELPSSIQEIHCENNSQLTSIHLGNIEQLNVLNVSNTNVHIIYDYPGVVDFKMENTPSIEFRDAVENISLNNSNTENMEEEMKIKQNYIEGLDVYFLLKSNYEKKLLEAKRKVFRSAVTKKIAKNSVAFVKIPCIKLIHVFFSPGPPVANPCINIFTSGVLLGTFVFFYFLSCGLHGCLVFADLTCFLHLLNCSCIVYLFSYWIPYSMY